LKIQLLAFWSFLLFLCPAWGGEFFHFYGPTKNLSFIRIHASPVISRVQLTGALAPLNFFINGENKTESLENLPCPKKELGLYVNQQYYPLEGSHLRFYAELLGSGITQLDIELIGRTKCYRTSMPLSHNIFQQSIEEKLEIEERQFKSPYPFVLLGPLDENVKVEMSNGKLTHSEGRATFETLLNEGENLFAGISKNRDGAEEILSYKLTLTREQFSPDRPTLSLKNNDFDWSAETVVLKQELEQIEGYITPGWTLKINNQLVSRDDDGYFKYSLEWIKSLLELQFELIQPNGQTFREKRVLQVVGWTPTPPWYNPGPLKDRSLVLGLSIGSYFSSKDGHTQANASDKFKFAPTLSWAYKYNQLHFYTLKIRHIGKRFSQREGQSTELSDQYQFSFLKMWQLPLGFEFGTGVSYRMATQMRTTYFYSSSSTTQASSSDEAKFAGFDISLLLDRRFRLYHAWFLASSLGYHLSTGIPNKYDDSLFEIIYFRFERLF